MRGTVLTLQMVEGKRELREAIHLTLFGGALRTTVKEDISFRFTQVKMTAYSLYGYTFFKKSYMHNCIFSATFETSVQ